MKQEADMLSKPLTKDAVRLRVSLDVFVSWGGRQAEHDSGRGELSFMN